jgi:hypothetical protein
MSLRKNLDDLDANGQKGDWAFSNEDTILVLRWGDDVNDIAMLYVAVVPGAPLPWQWDGNKEAPTLSPSILVHGGQGQPDRWHGWLREGKLVTA